MDSSRISNWMNRAFAEARKAQDRTLPNPRVGAVIVKDGKLLSAGYHQGAGTAHAEDDALSKAGEKARGAELFCTLEPCSSTYTGKRRPPCTDLIIKAGIQRVYIASTDPNPRVNGQGMEKLKRAGIQVLAGINEREGEILNREFFFSMRNGRPFVTLKAAITLDGKIAAMDGSSKWITDEKARTQVHQQRAECDAILIGSGTLNADNPSLTVRRSSGKNPLRIILGRKLDLNWNSAVFSPPLKEETLVFYDSHIPSERKRQAKEKGIQLIPVENRSPDDFLLRMLQELHKREIRSVMVEGGMKILTAFLRAGLFEKISFYMAPKILGSGKAVCGDLGITEMGKALCLAEADAQVIGGGQVLITGFRPGYSRCKGGVECSQD